MTTNITNTYEHLPPSGKAPQSLVILLHGLGSNGQDLIGLAPSWTQILPDTVFVSPDAPFPCDMAPPGTPNCYQWFSLQTREPTQIFRGVKTAMPILQNFITAQMEKYNIAAEKTALVGFSQGTMMSLYMGLNADFKGGPLAGVLGYSGALVGDAGKNKLPIHLIHGEADDVVPVAEYHRAKETLEAAGLKVSGHTTPHLPHSIDAQGLNSGGAFLWNII